MSRLIRPLLLLIVIGSLGYFTFYCVNASLNKSRQENLSELTDTVVDVKNVYQTGPTAVSLSREDKVISKYRALYLKNKNLIGWLKIDDTNIDYPVMQSVNGNGDFYLNHDFDGNEDRNGTLFMDDECDSLKPSVNLIIYGHNMKSGQMFGTLTAYKSQDFYKKHSQLHFDTIFEEGSYEVAYVFESKVYSETDITFKYYQFIDPVSEAEFDSAIKSMQEMSIYDTGVEVKYGDRLLTLSTCDYDEENGRFVVVCRRR